MDNPMTKIEQMRKDKKKKVYNAIPNSKGQPNYEVEAKVKSGEGHGR